jgi:cobalamin biosynthesis protein CobW
VALPEIDDPEALLDRLKSVAETHDVLRIKGFAAVAGKPMRLAVQGVGARFRIAFDKPWPATDSRQGQIVVIGQTGLDRDAIEAHILG